MKSCNDSSPFPKRTERKASDIFRQKKAIEMNTYLKNFPSSLPQIYPSVDSSFIDMRKGENEIDKSDSVSTFSDGENHSCNENEKILMGGPNCSIDAPNVSIISTSVPCRNLMDQFNTLEISLDQEDEVMSPEEKLKHCRKEQSPAGVDAFISFPDNAYGFPLHSSLQLSLSQSTVDRVSFYGVIHDINKEASSMASNDTKQSHSEELSSALLEAVSTHIHHTNSYTDESCSPSGTVLIDQEDWLLGAINSSSTDEFTPRACPPGFAVAIGEEEPVSGKNAFENTIADSKTQLWKPSRSWWEARSGKNPWIEPNSHNKRWRYLWPLIHYHKFLTKCIKKLKRHSIDVRLSESPVCAFLREEVCAVSEHLANVSKFSAVEWVDSLRHFEGWTEQSPEAESKLRALVRQLKLKSDSDDADLDSQLLRNQIDESFLKAMAEAKEQMVNGAAIQQKMKSIAEEDSCQQDFGGIPSKNKNERSRNPSMSNATDQSGFPQMYFHPQNGMQYFIPPSGLPPKQTRKPGKARRGNNRKVKDALSMWTTQKKFNPSMYATPVHNTMMHQPCGPYGYYPGYDSYGHPPSHNVPVYPEWEYPPNHVYQRGYNGYDQIPFPPHYNLDDNGSLPTYGAPYVQPPYAAQQSPKSSRSSIDNSLPAAPPTPNVPEPAKDAPITTPYKQTPPTSNHPHSPFWGHLDQGTLAMAGLMTPGGLTSPHHPTIVTVDEKSTEHGDVMDYGKSQLWINPTAGYYHHQQHGVPPSPATQFMMSNNSNSFHIAGANGQLGLNAPVSNEGPKTKVEIEKTSQEIEK